MKETDPLVTHEMFTVSEALLAIVHFSADSRDEHGEISGFFREVSEVEHRHFTCRGQHAGYLFVVGENNQGSNPAQPDITPIR